MARSSNEWVAGDRTWSRVYAVVQWTTLPVTALLIAVLALNILWDVGAITSSQAGILSGAVPYGVLGEWVWAGPVLTLTLAMLVLQTSKAVLKVAPTPRGLALRNSLSASWVIPWMDIRWTSPTRLEWIQLLGTGRAVVTPEQSQRIYRWFYPS